MQYGKIENARVIVLSQQPLRILFFFGVMNRGGAETFVMDVYRHIDRSRIQFDFVVHSHREGHFDREIYELGGRIFHIAAPVWSRLWKYERDVRRILTEYGPFAGVHSQLYYFSGLVLQSAKACGIPIRIANSNSIRDGYRDTPLRTMYRRMMQRKIAACSTHMLGVSTAACKSLFGDDCFASGKVRIVPNGIHTDKYLRLPEDKQQLRRKLGLPEDTLLIGHVGRFDPPKNHRFLLRVFADLLARVPNAHLLLAGDGPLRAEIEQTASRYGIEDRVLLLGVRDDVPDLLAAMDVFVFPSLYEGLGLAAIESQAAGVPSVIARTVPGEVDLGLGLIAFADLEERTDGWVEAILRQRGRGKISRDAIERRIIERNLEISQSSRLLQSIYCSAHNT
ncbi:glycosyltransferase family 1 protein [Paenibacillus sp. MSJ-34]|uniref:glycosyltransferase family 1 protein n=1 Tax=Paenibacillus sp. MSJ-34 TaxID=2841529 RepID=UPI001C10F9F1|nr:glycosyltransferase family 1 protein [Paenibacillus sp. MSJ-34]MBU5443473.1 glycosyltransferase family 1 protein [Paenibacillus sp. MSJ-34]